jgi:hypothetical protein
MLFNINWSPREKLLKQRKGKMFIETKGRGRVGEII